MSERALACCACRYRAHADAQLRFAAGDAALNVLKGNPSLRNVLLVNMAGFITGVPDEAQQVSRSTVRD